MAEIDVQRGGPGIWPWIVGLVVAALLIWILAGMFGEEEVVEAEPATQITPLPAAPPAGYLLKT